MILHDPQTRQEWLMHRNGGIGGSDAACVVGLNQYKSNVQLWEEKVGLSKAKDISNQAAVAFGIAAEPVIRDLFQVEHPEFEIEHHPFRMYAEENHKWLYATLDGELMLRQENARGILKSKRAPYRTARSGKNGTISFRRITMYKCCTSCLLPDGISCACVHISGIPPAECRENKSGSIQSCAVMFWMIWNGCWKKKKHSGKWCRHKQSLH